MTFILALFGKLMARPALLAGVIGAGAFGGFTIYHVKVTDGARERYVERLEADNASKAATIANQHLSIAQERLNVSMLMGRISDQNAAIEQMALKAKTAELSAGLAASQAFSKGLAAAKALADPTTTVKPGAVEMTAWWAERFGEK